MYEFFFQTLTTAKPSPVKMVGRVWMESTHLHVDVDLGLLEHIARQVCTITLTIHQHNSQRDLSSISARC